MADIVYNSFVEYLGDGTIDMDDHTFKLMLLSDSYTPAATHSVLADVSGYEISGTGYTAGGLTLSATWNRSAGTVTFDATDAQWTGATFSARYGVIYDDSVASPVVKPLMKLFDFGEVKSPSSGTFTIQFNASGILTLAVPA